MPCDEHQEKAFAMSRWSLLICRQSQSRKNKYLCFKLKKFLVIYREVWNFRASLLRFLPTATYMLKQWIFFRVSIFLIRTLMAWGISVEISVFFVEGSNDSLHWISFWRNTYRVDNTCMEIRKNRVHWQLPRSVIATRKFWINLVTKTWKVWIYTPSHSSIVPENNIKVNPQASQIGLVWDGRKKMSVWEKSSSCPRWMFLFSISHDGSFFRWSLRALPNFRVLLHKIPSSWWRNFLINPCFNLQSAIVPPRPAWLVNSFSLLLL